MHRNSKFGRRVIHANNINEILGVMQPLLGTFSINRRQIDKTKQKTAESLDPLTAGMQLKDMNYSNITSNSRILWGKEKIIIRCDLH